MTRLLRIRLSRKKGWRMPPNTVKVTRPGKWGNPFNFRDGAHCWTALTYGCRGDRRGRQEASVKAHREWIDQGEGRRTIVYERQASFGNDTTSVPIAPLVKAGPAPSLEDLRSELRGKNLACWCHLCARHAEGKPLDELCPDCDPCHIDTLGELANR